MKFFTDNFQLKEQLQMENILFSVVLVGYKKKLNLLKINNIE